MFGRKRKERVLKGIVFGMVLLCWIGPSVAQDEWPREITTQEGKITVYQPQLESFKGDKVSARAALSITKKEVKEPAFGVVWFSARTMTNRDTRMVEFSDLKIERVKFPFSTKDQEKRYAEFLSKDVNNWERTPMALDRFLAQIAAVEKEKASDDQINNDPPKIIFTTVPSALIVINGKPELRKVENSDLERVVNTPFAILLVPSTKTYYLKGGAFWYSTQDPMGKWIPIANPPTPVIDIVNRVAEKEDPSDGGQNQPQPKEPPQIIVATQPTELIVADGEPKFESVTGTGLLYMSNTPSEVLMEVKTQQYYVLLAGRWFRSSSLEKGPWTYVPSEKLSSDFMKIPPGSAKGHLLAFVAGTTQAQEAVLDAQIPQTAAIKRSEAKLTVTYDGQPKFAKIKGTAMEYAENTGTQVLRVKGRYYACDNAVWFVSESPGGPWVVADSIPDEIDTLPPDSPVYNVKYVQVYDSTPEVVYVGYTPGYVGNYVYEGTVVYGTGYAYTPWVGAYYYPWPLTWGFAPIYDPFYCSWGFGWGFGWGYGAGYLPWVGWGIGWGWGAGWGWGWGGWWYGWGWGGWHHWGWHHPWYPYHAGAGGPHRSGYRYGGARPEARQNLYNHGTNAARNAWASREGRPGQDWKGTRDRTPGKDFRGPQNRTPGKDFRGPSDKTSRQGGRSTQKQWDRTSPRRNNNVFADRNGDVYRRTNKGWEQRTQSGWSRPGTSPQTRQNLTQSRPNLDRDFSARQRGFERSRDFNQSFRGFSGGTPRGGGPSGAYNPGGGVLGGGGSPGGGGIGGGGSGHGGGGIGGGGSGGHGGGGVGGGGGPAGRR